MYTVEFLGRDLASETNDNGAAFIEAICNADTRTVLASTDYGRRYLENYMIVER